MKKFINFLAVSLVLIISCTNNNKKEKAQLKIREIILYYEVSSKEESGQENLTNGKSRSYTDLKLIQLFEKAKPTNNFFLWKGSIGGLVLYGNGDSAKLRISRYGAYFINLKKNQSYTFPNNELKNQWRTFIDSFLNNAY